MITAETITDEQIRELAPGSPSHSMLLGEYSDLVEHALFPADLCARSSEASAMRRAARNRIASILNARGAK